MAKKGGAAKRKATDKRLMEQEPPVIVGGGQSVVIRVRKDLGITGGGVSGMYKVYKIRYVDALSLDVFEDDASTGNSFVLDPTTHESVYWDFPSISKRKSLRRRKRR